MILMVLLLKIIELNAPIEEENLIQIAYQYIKNLATIKRKDQYSIQNKQRAVNGILEIPTTKKIRKRTTKISGTKSKTSENKAKWKREHEDFVKALKMSRLIK